MNRVPHRADTRLLLLALPLLCLLLLPFVALLLAATPSTLVRAIQDPAFGPALWLSARTSTVSLGIVVLTGTPLAWWLADRPTRATRWVSVFVDLPIVIPPAVLGIGLLQAFGRSGLFGPSLDLLGISIPFSTLAVVMAQVVVSAPFYVQAAASAFRRVDGDLLVVARTLGQSPTGALLRVALPIALPGLMAGAALAWARSLGEFGATLLFAGNLPGTTQTMPLAIYSALETDVDVAIALSLSLAGASVLALLILRTMAERDGQPSRAASGDRA